MGKMQATQHSLLHTTSSYSFINVVNASSCASHKRASHDIDDMERERESENDRGKNSDFFLLHL